MTSGAGKLVNEGEYSFGKKHKLLNKSQFIQVFAARQVLSSSNFLLQFCPNKGEGPRLGVVIAKKQVKTAVLRNAIKRQARELFRHCRHDLPAMDMVLRVSRPQKKPANSVGGGAVSSLQKRWQSEMRDLFQRLRARCG